MAPGRCYEFGPFRLDPTERQLFRAGEAVPLTPKAIDTLVYLVERRAHTVEKKELIERIWPNTFVQDSSLTQVIWMLRKTLGDNAESHDYIATAPKRGYRFVAAVHEVGDGATEAVNSTVAGAPVTPRDRASPFSTSPTAGPRLRKEFVLGLVALGAALVAFVAVVSGLRNVRTSVPRRRIEALAVLPFENLSHNPAEDYLADGITDELITQLAKIQALRVISRTSAMAYKGTRKPLRQIARELNLDAVVEGTVSRSGARVRVSAQLVEAAEDRHLWGESYERDLRDVLALQGEVARAIVEQIQVELTPRERSRLASSRPVDAEAYEAYLKGTFYWSRNWQGDVKHALDSFDQAIKKDPTYAPAYVGLAGCYFRLGDNRLLPRSETYAKGKAAAMKALAMDDTLSEGHSMLAEVLFRYDWDWTPAEREFRRAIELGPGSPSARIRYAVFLTAMGKSNEGLAEGRRACASDPVSHFTCEEFGELHFFAHQFDQAIEVWRKTLELYPDSASTHYALSRALAQKGLNAEARTETLRAEELWGADQRTLSTYRYAYSRFGMPGIWRKEIELARYPHPFDFARLYAQLGEQDRAFKWLEKSFDERDYRMVLLKVEPELDGLHPDPRFQGLLQRVGLSP